MKKELKIEIAHKLIDLMRSEGTNWTKPWVAVGAQRNARTGRPYRGVNVLLTGMAAAAYGFKSPYWNTYKGWSEMGHQVAKGSKGTGVIFWKQISTKDDNGEEKTFPIMRGYTVFNAEQLTGEFYPREAIQDTPPNAIERQEHADQIIADTGARISYGGDRAYYRPSTDEICLPPVEAFRATDAFYGVAFHELGHWTGHASRLDRNMSGWFGSPDYAFEELVAEITACLLCGLTGISPEPRPDHAQYLNGWLRGITEKPEAVSKAFSLAQKAADFILQEQSEAVELPKAA